MRPRYGRECMSQIVEVEILDLRQIADTSPVLLKRSHVGPTPEHSAVGNGGQRIVERPVHAFIVSNTGYVRVSVQAHAPRDT